MNALVDPRLERAWQFLLVDTESMEFDVLDNPNVGAMGGAGIQTAQLLASNGVQAVITGNCGPNAFTTLNAAGIQVYIGASGYRACPGLLRQRPYRIAHPARVRLRLHAKPRP